MSEAPSESSVVERDIEKLKALAKVPGVSIERLVVDYIVPILEAQREEYVGGFELMEDRIDEEVGTDPGFLARIVQAVASVGELADLALKRGGWADAQGVPTAECPDDMKVAFGGAQALVGSLTAEIAQRQGLGLDDGEEIE